jgi:hypothetical protein
MLHRLARAAALPPMPKPVWTALRDRPGMRSFPRAE